VGDEQARNVCRQLAFWTTWLLPVGMILGIGLGFTHFAAGDTALFDIWPLFRRKIFWGILEVLCSFFWMLAYWAWFIRWPPKGRTSRFFHGLLAVMSATNLLYHFPPLLTVMRKTAHGELTFSGPVSAADFRAVAYLPSVLAHSLHFWLASAAVSGVFLFWLTRHSADHDRFVRLGARIALGATLLQFPSGIWLLFATPQAAQSRLIGGHGLATALFLASLLGAFYLLQELATLAMGEVSAKQTKRTAALLVALVVSMSATLQLLSP